MAQSKKNGESAAARRARLLEEQRQAELKKKKKKTITIIIVVATILVVVGCAVGIPLGIKAHKNSYVNLELKNLCNSSGTALSASVKALDGRKVQVKGYLLECTSFTRFLAGEANAPCPFAKQKYVTNVIPAVYQDGSTFDPGSINSQKPYIVYGTLHVGDTVIAKYGNSSVGYSDEVAGMVIYVDRYELAK